MRRLLGRYMSLDKLAAKRKKASAPRDYKREYKLFHSSPEAKRNRVKRNLWNRRLKGKVPAGHEIDHKRQLRNGGGNGRDNIRFMPRSKNRAEHNRGKVVKDHMRKESAFKQKKYVVDREKVRRDLSRTNKNVGTAIGATSGIALGGKLGIAGSILGGVGGGLLGRKMGSKPVSDKKLDRYIRDAGLGDDQRFSDAELAAYGRAGLGNTLYRDKLRKKYEKTASFNPHQWVYDSLIKSLVRA